ncbi:hypothetical protein BaRGS_00033443 [Batillaria attramentaria]|uniref:Uncharacterized protein n=1 Tax=Batillaria attramentaria TaxID=370345 RepID=A0ABD0JK89_9CAEN
MSHRITLARPLFVAPCPRSAHVEPGDRSQHVTHGVGNSLHTKCRPLFSTPPPPLTLIILPASVWSKLKEKALVTTRPPLPGTPTHIHTLRVRSNGDLSPSPIHAQSVHSLYLLGSQLTSAWICESFTPLSTCVVKRG